jgi:hypothetical protein
MQGEITTHSRLSLTLPSNKNQRGFQTIDRRSDGPPSFNPNQSQFNVPIATLVLTATLKINCGSIFIKLPWVERMELEFLSGCK